jgi:hypothetical protein
LRLEVPADGSAAIAAAAMVSTRARIIIDKETGECFCKYFPFSLKWDADQGGAKSGITSGRNRLSDIGVISMEGDRKWRPLLQDRYNEAQPQISPDGRWMA